MMKTKKKKSMLSIMLVLVLMITMLTPIQADAATVKLSNKKVTIKAGQTTTLKVTTKAKANKIKWKSSNKKVAVVQVVNTKTSKKIKIFGIKKGTAKITATVNGKKFTCKVTVTANKKPTSKQIQNIMEGSLRAKGGYETFVENFNRRWDEGEFAQSVASGYCTYEQLLGYANDYNGFSHTKFYVDPKDIYGCMKNLVNFYEDFYNDGDNAKYGKKFFFRYTGKSNTGKWTYFCYFG